jgi:PIN domain nuclease of toxin-antitoxin system
MNSYVWDASALLALINNEPGHEKMEQYLPGAYMSSINISEVASILLSMSMKQSEIEQLIHSIIPNAIPFDNHHAYHAADLRIKTKNMGLSLGDRACLSLGEIKNLPVITADKIWGKLDLNIKIILIQ